MIGAIIRTGLEILCLSYAGFLKYASNKKLQAYPELPLIPSQIKNMCLSKGSDMASSICEICEKTSKCLGLLLELGTGAFFITETSQYHILLKVLLKSKCLDCFYLCVYYYDC